MRRQAPFSWLALVAAVLLAASCADGGQPDRAVSSVQPRTAITVFAASSLTEAFTQIGSAFTEANPNVDVNFNFSGSGSLVTQIDQGAPADVFASADDKSMSKLQDLDLLAALPRSIAKNVLEIIVEPQNPFGIMALDDLAQPGLIVVLCAATVPCGAGATESLAKAGVTVNVSSFEDKVKGVVTKVTTGEADAGIVYATDVRAAGSAARGVEIPTANNVVNNYPIAVIKGSTNQTAATAFVDFVASATGQEILSGFGFLAP